MPYQVSLTVASNRRAILVVLMARPTAAKNPVVGAVTVNAPGVAPDRKYIAPGVSPPD